MPRTVIADAQSARGVENRMTIGLLMLMLLMFGLTLLLRQEARLQHDRVPGRLLIGGAGLACLLLFLVGAVYSYRISQPSHISLASPSVVQLSRDAQISLTPRIPVDSANRVVSTINAPPQVAIGPPVVAVPQVIAPEIPAPLVVINSVDLLKSTTATPLPSDADPDIERERPSPTESQLPTAREHLRQVFLFPIWAVTVFFGTIVALVYLLWVGNNTVSSNTSISVPAPTLWRKAGWMLVPLGTCVGMILSPLLNADTPPVRPSAEAVRNVMGLTRMQLNLKDFVAKNMQSETPARLPDWMMRAANESLPAGQAVLTSGYFSSLEEAEAQLVPLVVELFRAESAVSRPDMSRWNPRTSQIRELVIQQEYLERTQKMIGKHDVELFRLFMLIDTSPKIVDAFVPEWRTHVTFDRLRYLGGVLGACCLWLFFGACYFRMYPLANTQGSWRWKAAFTAIGLISALPFLQVYS